MHYMMLMLNEVLFRAVADPGVYSEPTEKVSLYISCQNLANMDMFSKSDP